MKTFKLNSRTYSRTLMTHITIIILLHSTKMTRMINKPRSFLKNQVYPMILRKPLVHRLLTITFLNIIKKVEIMKMTMRVKQSMIWIIKFRHRFTVMLDQLMHLMIGPLLQSFINRMSSYQFSINNNSPRISTQEVLRIHLLW